jgi:hypothetical protein
VVKKFLLEGESAKIIREAIRLFDEMKEEPLPTTQTEEEAWEIYRKENQKE